MCAERPQPPTHRTQAQRAQGCDTYKYKSERERETRTNTSSSTNTHARARAQNAGLTWPAQGPAPRPPRGPTPSVVSQTTLARDTRAESRGRGAGTRGDAGKRRQAALAPAAQGSPETSQQDAPPTTGGGRASEGHAVRAPDAARLGSVLGKRGEAPLRSLGLHLGPARVQLLAVGVVPARGLRPAEGIC